MARQAGDTGRHWYVVHTYSGYEDAVREALMQRIESLGMQDLIFDVVVPKETQIVIKKGEPHDRLLLILNGEAHVMSNKKEIAVLTRKDFIAEMSLLSGEPASADVLCRKELTCITWSRENLDNLEKLNHILWSKLQHILSKDLVGKVRRTSSRL